MILWLFFFLIKLLYFFGICWLLFYLPGKKIIGFTKIKLDLFEKGLTALIIGIVFFTLTIYILGYLGLSYYIFLTIPFLVLIKERRELFAIPLGLFIKEIKRDLLLVFLLVSGIIFLNLPLFFSGLLDKDKNLIFTSDWAWHDLSWHISLIEELKKGIPPLNPIYKLQPLKDYHYFYDLLVAGVNQIAKINILDLIYRLFPILITLLLGLSVYLFTKILTKSKLAAKISLFLTYYCGSFAYLIPFLLNKNQNWGESSFWVSQTFSMAIQPHLLLSLAIFFTALILLRYWQKHKGISLSLIIAFLLGSLVGFKAYSVIAVAGGFAFLIIYQLLVKKEKKIILLGCLTLIIFLLVFLSNSSGKSSFFWAPLWFPKTMVEASDRLNLVDWVLKEEYYWYFHHYHNFIKIKIYELLVFIVGNLGIRFLGLMAIYSCLKSKIINRQILLFLIGSAAASFLFPLLFLQKGTVWNSIQTWYYLLVFVNILIAAGLSLLVKKKNKFFRWFIIGLILVLSLPTSVKSFINFNFQNSEVKYSSSEIEALERLRNLPNPDALTLLFPSSKNSHSTVVSALSGRRVYYANDHQADLFGVAFEKEKDKIRQFFLSKDVQIVRNFLKENKIKYLFFWPGEAKNMSDNFSKQFKLIFSNKGTSIYQFIE